MSTGIGTGTDLGAVAVPAPAPTPPLEEAVALGQNLHVALSEVLLGSPRAVTLAVVAALSGNHLLIEDVPGVGKTVLARALAAALGVPLSRIQGHPDLLPSDITGVTVFSPDTGTWDFRPGPVFGHVVLLDELNRTPPRTQSALLEAMEEQQVSVDGESWPLPRPYLVIGTQNPVGQLGTYPLVESQLDRFGISTSIGYPDAEVETRLVLHSGGHYALDTLVPVADTARWHRAIGATAAVQVVNTVAEYAVTPGPIDPVHRHRPPRGQPPCRHLPHPQRPGLRRSQRAGLCHTPGRAGGGRGLPGPSAGGRGRQWRGSRSGGPGHRRHPRSSHVTRRHPVPSDDGRRWRGMRAVNAAITGLVAGVCGVVVIRAVFGPGVVLAGASVGLLAMIVAALVSWRALPSGRRRRSRSRLPGERRLRRRVHPVGWIAPMAGSGLALVAFAGVAHSSGSGWVQAVGALLAGVLLTGLVAPVIPARRATVMCTNCPSDAEAGGSVEITLVANGPVRIRPLDPTGAEARATGPIRGSRQVSVTVNPQRRGVLTAVRMEVGSSAPFGLVWWARQTMVELPRPLHVAPRLGQPRPLAVAAQDPPGDAWRRMAADTGEPRGIRPYQAGDTRRSVHWPATSHVGSVMVREKGTPDRRSGAGRTGPACRPPGGRSRDRGHEGVDHRRPRAGSTGHPPDPGERRDGDPVRTGPDRPRAATGPGRASPHTGNGDP